MPIPPQTKTLHVLLVDGDPETIAHVEEAMTPVGVEVTQATDIDYVKVLLALESFDLVLVDIDIPQSAGIGLLRWIVANSPYQRTVVLTRSPDVATAIELMKLGAADYLPKPPPDGRLVDLLDPDFVPPTEASLPTLHKQHAVRAAPREIAGYQINGTLGEGGMSVVFDATWNGKHVALKLYKNDESNPEKHQARITRFLREASILMDIQHPNVVEAYDIGVEALDTGTIIPYIALEFVKGYTLMDAIGPNHTILDIPTRVRMLAQLAEGFATIHAAGIVHRDVKPDNLVVTTDGTVKIMDLGIAWTPDSSLTGADELLGYPVFMSPESFLTSRVDHRADIFSFGTTAYYFLLNELPFHGTSVAMLSDQVRHSNPRRPLNITSAFPLVLTRILAGMLAKDPDDRYQSMAHIAADLHAFSHNPTITVGDLQHCPPTNFWL